MIQVDLELGVKLGAGYRCMSNLKKPAVTLAFGCGWIVLDVEVVEGRGIEPPTSTLRTLRSPN